MGETDGIPMLTEFPKWLASTSMGNQPDVTRNRWSGIAALAEAPAFAFSEALIRQAFNTKQRPDADALQEIRKVFYAVDNTFSLQGGNDEELRVLAASALAARMTQPTTAGAKTALAVRTALAEGYRAPQLPMDLAILSAAALQAIAEENGERPNLSPYITAEASKVDFSQAIAKAKDGTPEAIAAAFTAAAEAMRGTVGGMAQRQRNVVDVLDKFLRIQDEELQMLWWLVGQRSFDLNIGFTKIAPVVKPLVMAKELADLTAIPPGPRALEALLVRAGLTEEPPKTRLTDAIMAADEDWARSFVGGQNYSAVTTPLHLALQRQLETGKGDAWVSSWAAVTEISAEAELAPLALALQFYRERLILSFEDE